MRKDRGEGEVRKVDWRHHLARLPFGLELKAVLKSPTNGSRADH